MQFGRCFFVKNAEWVRKKRRNYPPQQVVGKVCFYKNRANPLSLTPNPFPVVKGCVCLVGFASCKALVHTRPASVPGLSVGLPPSPRLGLRPKQGCFGCLPKVLHDAKPAERATLNTHFWITIEVFRQTEPPSHDGGSDFYLSISFTRLNSYHRILR